MTVSVVLVRHMRVGMPSRLVAAQMALRAGLHDVMLMIVMPVIVTVGVLVFSRFVHVLMPMAFGQMQQDKRANACHNVGKFSPKPTASSVVANAPNAPGRGCHHHRENPDDSGAASLGAVQHQHHATQGEQCHREEQRTDQRRTCIQQCRR
ncbi:MAG: hypothetical protein H7Z15_13805 [Rhizobacter sp.]|nr:hypothetical protein [Rhizobacter sp.]